MGEGALGRPPAPTELPQLVGVGSCTKAFSIVRPVKKAPYLFLCCFLAVSLLLCLSRHAVPAQEKRLFSLSPAAPSGSGGSLWGPAVLTVTVLVGPRGKQIAEA